MLSDLLQRHWWRPRPSALARALQPLAALLQGLARLDKRYRSRGAARLPVPVIVVGNLIVGGAGKTPTVIALLRVLQQQGWRPGVVSRGYGRSGDGLVLVTRGSDARECGDEPLLIHLRSGAPVAVARDRLQAAQALLAANPAVNLLLADDGLQHWRLPRDLQVLVFDARGAGNGLTLPAGPLRQPLPERLPADTLLLYNAAAPSTALPGWLVQRRLAGAVSLAGWWAGEAATLPALHALRALPSLTAAAGLGQPERFFTMLEAEGLRIARLPLADHARLDTLPWPPGTADVVVTEKDAVKLRPEGVGATRVWVAALDFGLPPDFVHALLARLRAAAAARALPPS
ncbi:MAG TPA: tetraacyldisaccharide 4'-kinase [Ideonella sp.]|nr:tetraacyldisaccharide 4'-kinase [Ideonella sp.]